MYKLIEIVGQDSRYMDYEKLSKYNRSGPVILRPSGGGYGEDRPPLFIKNVLTFLFRLFSSSSFYLFDRSVVALGHKAYSLCPIGSS